MTVKLIGMIGPADLDRAQVQIADHEKRIDAIWVSLCALIARVEKIESVNAVAHELPEKSAKKAKS